MPFDESHVDDDVLALLALGETAGTTADLAHVEECERCADEVAALRSVVDARPVARRTRSSRPRPHVWDRISDELGSRAGRPHGDGGAVATPARRAAPARPAVVALDRAAPSRRAHVALDRRPRRPWASLVGGGRGLVADDRRRPASVARDRDARAAARLGRGRVGRRRDLARRHPGARRRPRRAEAGRRRVPRGLAAQAGRQRPGQRRHARRVVGPVRPAGRARPDEFSVVDVSEEQFDGDPAHSGDSIVRGALRVCGRRRPPHRVQICAGGRRSAAHRRGAPTTSRCVVLLRWAFMAIARISASSPAPMQM